MLVLGYSWHDEKPSLLLRDGNEQKKFQLVGEFNAEILPNKWCIGHYAVEKISEESPFSFCDNQIHGWKNQCEECEQKDAILPCMKCRGDGCTAVESVRESCKKEKFCVYLALFGGIPKVGVSRDRRFTERLLEQGADFGAKIAYGNGLECRRAERAIARLGVRDAVSYQLKIISLGRTRLEILEEAYENAKKSLGDIISEPFHPLDFSKYHPQLKISPVYSPVESGQLEETILGAKGQLLFFESGKVIDMKKLSARKIEVHV